MARIEASWSNEHLADISRLEDKLGRPVCGVPSASGPCGAAAERNGRCALHEPSGSSERDWLMVHERMRPAPLSRSVLVWTSLSLAVALGVVGFVSSRMHDPAEGLWRQSAELLKEGRRSEALPLLVLILRDYPRSPYADKAREITGGVVSSSTTVSDAEKLFNEARNFYPLSSHSRYDLEGAVKRYSQVADSYPADPLARSALFEAAACLDQLGRYDDTVKLWKRFINDYPTDGRTPEAMYALGYLYYNQMSDRAKGKTIFLELIRRFPDSSSAEAAQNILGIAPTTNILPTAEAPSYPSPGSNPGSGSGSGTGAPSVQTEPGGM